MIATDRRHRAAKNKAMLLKASLSGEQSEEILHKAIELAMGGNVPMIKFYLNVYCRSCFSRPY